MASLSQSCSGTPHKDGMPHEIVLANFWVQTDEMKVKKKEEKKTTTALAVQSSIRKHMANRIESEPNGRNSRTIHDFFNNVLANFIEQECNSQS